METRPSPARGSSPSEDPGSVSLGLGRRPVSLSAATLRQEVGEGSGRSWGLAVLGEKVSINLGWGGASWKASWKERQPQARTGAQHMQRPVRERSFGCVCGDVKS